MIFGKARQGFTLVEIVCVLVLMGILGSMGYMVLTTGIVSWTRAKTVSNTAQVMDTAMRRLSMEVRESLPPTGQPGLFVDGDELVYRTPDGDDRRIGRDTGRLYMESGGTRHTMARGVAGFSTTISYGDQDGDGTADEVVSVDMTVSTDDGKTWSTAARPRQPHGR